MKEVNESRIQKVTTAFSILIFLLSLTPIASNSAPSSAFVFSIMYVRDQDDFDAVLGPLKFYYWSNVPFTVVVAFATVINVFASLTIFVSNLKSNKTKTIYYSSIIGMLVTFGIGSFLVNQAI